MNIVSYGGGLNSTAMLIEMAKQKIPVDLILFADTGGEQPETYAYVKLFDNWLQEHGYPAIQVLEYRDKNGERLTLEQECLRCHGLPSIAYGHKKCSQKHKIGVVDKFCNNLPACRAVWEQDEKITKFIGYDAGEERRRQHALVYDMQDTKYRKDYFLMEMDLDREGCQRVVADSGLPIPEKSSCFFCPSMKREEIRRLRVRHPDLFKRALAIEDNAKDTLQTVKGLGRNFSWRDFVEGTDAQVKLCGMLDEWDMPCGCYDG